MLCGISMLCVGMFPPVGGGFLLEATNNIHGFCNMEQVPEAVKIYIGCRICRRNNINIDIGKHTCHVSDHNFCQDGVLAGQDGMLESNVNVATYPCSSKGVINVEERPPFFIIHVPEDTCYCGKTYDSPIECTIGIIRGCKPELHDYKSM